MENFNVPADVVTRLIRALDKIDARLETKTKEQPLSEIWLDVSETCMVLKVSKRTLQQYRDKGILPFSQISGKIYFRAADIEKHLQTHMVEAFASKK
ncbi:MAG: DNA-binding protein [Bacteroidetes bacterium]|nr:MAG: DNA-binding protein [Bacteroidota bacterium]